MAHLYNEDIK